MIYQELIDQNNKLAVIGLGYVGLPIALEFAKKIEVITGMVNKVGAILAWLVPKAISEKIAKGIYE